jgi:hypothetical protein
MAIAGKMLAILPAHGRLLSLQYSDDLHHDEIFEYSSIPTNVSTTRTTTKHYKTLAALPANTNRYKCCRLCCEIMTAHLKVKDCGNRPAGPYLVLQGDPEDLTKKQTSNDLKP